MTATHADQPATSADHSTIPSARSRRWHAPVETSVANPRRTRGLALEEILGVTQG